MPTESIPETSLAAETVPHGGAQPLLAALRAARRLPSPPRTAMRVVELCRRDDTELSDIADTIGSDPALSGRLLRYANSPMAGVGRSVTTVRDAVVLLGMRATKLVALGFSLPGPDRRVPCAGFEWPAFWSESFLTAVCARRLADLSSGIDREEAFAAGLLAGVGRSILAHGLPEEYGWVLEQAGAAESLIEAEQAGLGTDHAKLGAEILKEWGLPEVLVQAIEYQYHPEQANERVRPIARILARSQELAMTTLGGDHIRPAGGDLHLLESCKLPYDTEAVERLVDQIIGDYRDMKSLFETELATASAAVDLLADAQEEATRVGLIAQFEQARFARTNQELLKRATTDALTGIANRAEFDQRLHAAWKGLDRGHGHFALLLIDVDRLKTINDSFGHQAGDDALRHLAAVLKQTIREVDLAARYGGDEFAVLAPWTDERGALVLADRIRESIERVPLEFNDESIRLRVSVGLALTSGYTRFPQLDELLADADKQLYVAKKAGGNTWSYQDRPASRNA
ncbi:MAG: GGDEF domain-containing protein [bacterium]|nr:GGDEF domain-containing protein [bacterium]